MTFLLGLKCLDGSIVLADSLHVVLDGNGVPMSKEYYSKSAVIGEYCLGYACSNETEDFHAFFRLLRNPRNKSSKGFREELESAISSRDRLMIIDELNARLVESHGEDAAVSFVLGTLEDVYLIDGWGNLIPSRKYTDRNGCGIPHVALGNCSEEISAELSKKGVEEVDLGRGIKIAYEVFNSLKGDIYVGGLPDLTVISHSGAKSFLEIISRYVAAAETESIEKIIRELG